MAKPSQVWLPGETVEALAYDTPIPGWRGAHINTLRLGLRGRLTPCASTSSTAAITSAH